MSAVEVLSLAQRSKNGQILGGNQSPFSPLIPLKAFLEIDYTESLAPIWITVAQFQSHFSRLKIRAFILLAREVRRRLQSEHQRPLLLE